MHNGASQDLQSFTLEALLSGIVEDCPILCLTCAVSCFLDLCRSE